MQTISAALREKLLPLSLALACGGFLLVTAVPGTFTTDENNYNLAAATLSRGSLAVPGYSGLPYTHGARYFDPAPLAPREVPEPATPADFAIPPLHAVFALPFISLGWHGLVLLNLLGFLAGAAAVFIYARAFASRSQTPVIALLAFTVGNFMVEYAQGTWPHALSVGLVAMGTCCAALARRDNAAALAVAAGFVLGAAVGVRFQNTVFLAAAVLTFLLARRHRLAAAAALGATVPLLTTSVLRFMRSGALNPFARRGGYMKPSLGGAVTDQPAWLEPIAVFWAKVVDYTTHPPLAGALHTYLTKDEVTGAILVGHSLKKAWMQSSPWIAIALAGLLLAWRAVRTAGDRQAIQQRELRMLGVLLFPMLAALCVAGFARTDGGAFSQRYFLEMTPLAAVAFSLLLERAKPLERLPVLVGAGAITVLLVTVLMSSVDGSAKIRFTMYMPIVLGAVGLVFWVRGDRSPRLLSVAVGAMIAWAFTLHLIDDLPASRHQRTFNAMRKDAIAEAFRQPAAVFAYSYNKDALGPLQLEQDLLVFETAYDHVERLEMLAAALAKQGRNIYLLTNDMPEEIGVALIRAVGNQPTHRVYPVADDMEPLTVLELGTAAAPAVAVD